MMKEINNFTPTKGKGQNFLVDKNILKKMVNAIGANSKIVEIGPGSGNFTDYILDLSNDITLVEIDENLVVYLKKKYLDYSNVEIVHADATKILFKDYFEGKFTVVGNLPYSVARNIFFNILKNYKNIDNGFFLIQKEAADKLFLTSKERSYSVLRFFINHYYKLTYLFNVSPNSFRPRPTIQSTYFSISKHENKEFFEPKQYLKFLTIIFKSQRKKISNNLKKFNIDDISNDILNKRAGELSLLDIENIFRKIILEEE